MSLFLVILAILIISYLLYHFIARQSQLEKLKKQIEATDIDLQKCRGVEKQLREELNTLQNKLHLAFQDPVTELPVWQLFEDRLSQRIKECERYQFILSVMLVDIDEFKLINDGLGYEKGDVLLKEVANRLKASIRQVDNVSRLSKDTFVILLSQLSKPETAAIVAQRILQTLSEPFQMNGNELYLTASIGIALYPSDAKNLSTLLQRADEALHLAKEKGKHSYQFYSQDVGVKSQRELILYSSLNRESMYQEFVVYYQPIIDVKKESIACMQALLHWQHPHLGLVYPQEIIHLAEKQGRLNAINEWLLRTACQQFLHWRSLGFYPELLSVSVSIKQLENTRFIYQISQILQELNFKPEWLLLEITDTILMSLDVLEKAFNMLHYLGIKIAIDSFGANSFALYYLKHFSFDYLKLDRSFTEDLVSSQQSVAIIQSMISLAKNLSCHVIVQGVETEEQKELLKNLGCHLMQGQLLGAPLPEHEVAF